MFELLLLIGFLYAGFFPPTSTPARRTTQPESIAIQQGRISSTRSQE